MAFHVSRVCAGDHTEITHGIDLDAQVVELLTLCGELQCRLASVNIRDVVCTTRERHFLVLPETMNEGLRRVVGG